MPNLSLTLVFVGRYPECFGRFVKGFVHHTLPLHKSSLAELLNNGPVLSYCRLHVTTPTKPALKGKNPPVRRIYWEADSLPRFSSFLLLGKKHQFTAWKWAWALMNRTDLMMFHKDMSLSMGFHTHLYSDFQPNFAVFPLSLSFSLSVYFCLKIHIFLSVCVLCVWCVCESMNSSLYKRTAQHCTAHGLILFTSDLFKGTFTS